MKAEIILDSIINNERVTCMRVTYPRIVHSEFLRHRVFSINSQSSRATPFNRMVDQYAIFTPTLWRKHKPGMQPIENHEWSEKDLNEINDSYFWIKRKSIEIARYLHEVKKVSKEQVNRLIEPYSNIVHIVQTTEKGYKSFFDLRITEHAQFEIREIAKLMKKIYDESKPIKRDIHLPFYNKESYEEKHIISFMMASAARCARTSYYNHDGKEPRMIDDLRLARRLKKDYHMSPFEFPVLDINIAKFIFREKIEFFEEIDKSRYQNILSNTMIIKDFSGNLNNWKLVQFRKLIEAGV